MMLYTKSVIATMTTTTLTLLCCYSRWEICDSFPIVPIVRNQRKTFVVSSQKEQTYYNDFDDFWPESHNEVETEEDDDWKDWFSELQTRQEELSQQAKEKSQQKETSDASSHGNTDGDIEKIKSNWMSATCTSTIRLALSNDWIRRVAINYPLAIVGGCSGRLYLADLDAGHVLDAIDDEDEDDDNYTDEDVHAAYDVLPSQEEAIRILYGDYDGGGIISLAFHQDYVYSSGREGGFHVCQLFSLKGNIRLIPHGHVSASTNTIITSLATDSQHVWAAGFNGILYGYPHQATLDQDEDQDEEEEEYIINKYGEIMQDYDEDEDDIIQIDLESPIIQVDVSDALGLGVCSTHDGKVHLFSLQDGAILDQWAAFPSSNNQKSNKHFARSVHIASQDKENYSVVVGGFRGQLYSRPILQNKFAKQESIQRLRPSHAGPVVSITCPTPGILITGAQDGTIRVWDTSKQICLYALTGYKVWLGSIVSDGKRLISDGADNTIVVHDFSGEDNDDNHNENVSLEEDDTNDDMDDYTLD